MDQRDEGFEERRSIFVKEIEGYFARGDVDDALKALDDVNNVEHFNASGYELIPIMGKFVTGKMKTENPATFRGAQQILDKISKDFSPQETYLELLEQAEDSDDVKFTVMLEIIKFCLLRMPNQRGKSICWICHTTLRHLCNMETPTLQKDDDGDDVSFGKSNLEIVRSISTVYDVIVEFFCPFVQELRGDNCLVPTDHRNEYEDNVLKCLLKCLGRPLVNVDLSKESKLRAVASRILDMIGCLAHDPLTFLERVDNTFGCVELLEDDAVFVDFNNVSLGCYFYLIFDDPERLLNVSYVYSPKYLFECAMALSFDLMATNEAPLLFKALKLFHAILDRVSSRTIEFNQIRDAVMSKYLEMITRSMVHNEQKEVRQLSVQIFPKFLGKFTVEGQYMVLYNANQLSSNPGFIGYSMTLVKEQVRDALDTKDAMCLKFFTGKKLTDILNRYCKINGLIEADLQLHTDQIMSCLNLIRFILLRDKTDETGLSAYLTGVDESYIEPVKRACAFARGLYEDFKSNLDNPLDARIHLGIAGSDELLPEMTPEEQLQMMNESLTRVDMIDFLAARVSQCLTDYKRNRQHV